MVVVYWSQCHIVVRHPYGRGALVSMSYCCEASIWLWCTGLNVILLCGTHMVVVHLSQCHIVVRHPYGRGALISMSYCCEASI